MDQVLFPKRKSELSVKSKEQPYNAFAIPDHLCYSTAMSKRMKRKALRRALRGQQCYLCGKYGETEEEGIITQDHLPPHGLSPLSPDSDFLLLPAHSMCNNRYSLQERRVITFLASAGGYKGNASADTAWKAAERSFKFNEIGRAGEPSKDLLRLLKSSMLVDIYTPHGLYAGNKTICWPSEDTDIKLIIGKIARGLHYYHAHAFVPETWEISVFLEPVKPEHLPIFAKFSKFRQMGDFFSIAANAQTTVPFGRYAFTKKLTRLFLLRSLRLLMALKILSR